jgi:dephospho-CoA kinase
VLGVTGKYCSGKNALVSFLKDRGFSEIDVDGVGHRILEGDGVKAELRRHFGPDIFDQAGAIDRRALGQRVFRDSRELRELEAIVHQPMVADVEATLKRMSGPVVINAAVLFRMGLQRLCEAVICVRAPLIQSLIRARSRDGACLIRAIRRLRSQRGICPKLNGNGVDIYYVDNNRGLDHLHAQILEILREKGQQAR